MTTSWAWVRAGVRVLGMARQGSFGPGGAKSLRRAGMRALFAALITIVATLAGCKEEPPKKLPPSNITGAELRMIRRGVTVIPRGESERAPYARERLSEGAEVKIADGGLAWLRRDGGTTMLVRGPGKVGLTGDKLTIGEGKVFAEAPEGRVDTLEVPDASLVLSAVRASIEVHDGKTDAYVLSGEIRAGTTVAHAGELLHLAGKTASVEPALSWEDWTGGLATTDPSAAPAPFGVGTVGARVPGTLGAPYASLTIQRLDVRVAIEGDLAVTEVDQTFFNPQSTTVEGIYRFRAPEGALLSRFGVDRDGGILYGFVKEKAQAQAQYQAHVYQGSKEDPALLTWQAPGEYEARLYPIAPGATRRVVVRYSEWLPRAGEKADRRLYVYPMAFEGSEESAPYIEDLSIEVDVSKASWPDGKKPRAPVTIKAGADATRVGDVIVVREHDFVPRSDFALELYDAGVSDIKAVRAKHLPDLVALGAEEAKDARRKGDGEADYLLVPVRSSDAPKREEGLDLVIVVDTSAATDKAMLRMARATTRALLAHLGDKDRVLVLAGDDRLRPVAAGADALKKADRALADAVLEGLAKIESGGATDLAAMLSEATTKLGDERASAIVYIGDGTPTVGEAELATIRDRMKKAPRLVRTFGLGIGDGAAMATLAGLSSGGFAARVTDERSAAMAALRLCETAERAVDLGATIDLGSNVERIYPHELGAIVAGETSFVVGRVSGQAPKSATLKTVRGSAELALDVQELDDVGDLRRRWAMGRLDDLITEGAGHAALVDLGVRQGVITPVTSIYVPTTQEMTREQRDQIDRRKRTRTAVKRSGEDETVEQAEKKQAKEPEAPKATAAATASPDAKPSEDGFGNDKDGKSDDPISARGSTRRRGDEGRMGGDAPERTQNELLEQAKAPKAEEAQNYDGAPPQGGTGSGGTKNYRIESNNPSPMASAAPAAPPMPAPSSTARPGDLGNKGGLIDMPAPNGGPSATRDTRTLHDASAKTAEADKLKKVANGEPDDEQGFGIGAYAQGELSSIQKPTYVVVIDDPGRRVLRCGKGADVPFEERKGLWRERLSQTNANVAAVLRVYRQALAWCEAPTMRERRALLLLSLDYLPGIPARVSLYRALTSDAQAADVVYRAILARVTTPDQVRELNRTLGLATVDPETLEKTIKEAKDAADLVAKLRLLVTRFPDDLALGLRLLEALEDAADAPGARRLAKALRTRNDADAQVRTTVGELYLRLAATGSGEDKSTDEQEARRAFGEIVEFSPDDPVARRRLGDLYRAHGFYAEATRQYETLARLVPDDPTVPLLLAACANGLGKLEEAVRWTEKGQKAGAPDVAQGPHATARAFATLFLAWGRQDAKAAGRNDEWKALAARLDKITTGEKREGQVRVLLSWSHPELHTTLWSNALGTLMPSSEGDVSLGISQAILADRPGGLVEVRVEPSEVARAARLGAKATLTVVFGEGKDGEVIDRREVGFTRGGPATLRFSVGGNKVEEVKP